MRFSRGDRMPPALALSVPALNRPNQRLPRVAPLSVAMLASDPQLMPDSADNGRPSAAPLSVEDADRLADSFTAFWDDAPAPTDAPPIAAAPPVPAPRASADSQPFGDPELAPAAVPVAEPAATSVAIAAATSPATPTPHPGAVTQPMPVVAPVARVKPVGKQTLVGIAPINIEKPSASEPPPPSSPIQSSPSPAVPGYAIAYTPKDPPSTPAVVIAPEAQSAPDNPPPERRREFSQTVPSRVRSSPNASLSPPPPVAKPAIQEDDFNPYAPKKGKGKVIGLVLGGTLLLGASLFVVRGLGGSARELPTQTSSAASPAADVVRAATVVAATPTPEPTEPAPAAIPTPPARESEPVPARTPSERVPKAKTKAKAEPMAAPVARAATRAPAPEPSPPSPKPASKGVIVRDAPF